MSALTKTTSKMLLAGLALVVILAIAILTRQGEAKGTADNDRVAEAALSVALIRPVSTLWPDEVVADGEITAWQEALVNAEISGAKLTEMLVDVGDHVQAGQILARFEDKTARSSVAAQEAVLMDAESLLAEAEANAKRAHQLKDKLSISEQDLIRADTAKISATAQVALARAQLDSAKRALHNTVIRAPDAGIVSSRSALLGMVATPGLELFRIIRQGKLEWRPELMATDLARVTKGAKAEITLPGGGAVSGLVRRVAPVLNKNTRTGIIYIALDSEQVQAKTGMFAGGQIVVGERMAISVPATSVVQRDGHDMAFVVDEETGLVIKHRVTTGRRLADRIEILQGVSLSDALVESGGAFLNDGDRVRIVKTIATAGHVQ